MGWWFGSAVEAAWHSLHSVEEECARWVTDEQVRQLIADAKHHAQVAGLNDTAMVRELNEATKDSPVEAYVRPLAAAILRRAHEQSTASAQDARALRNRILLASLACGGLIAIVAAVIASLPPGTAIVSAAQSLGLSPGQLVGIVIVFGAVGGLFTAIPAFTAIPTDRSPYNLPLQQGILKIFLAPVTAAVGLLAIGAGLVDISEWSFYQLAAFATAFGAGQQAVTQAVDRWARIALDPKNAA